MQGVGFRPAVARIAAEYGLSGWVCNDAGAVHCEWEGAPAAIDAAVAALWDRPPPIARIDTLDRTVVTPVGERGFAIIASRSQDTERTLVPPDIAVCAECLSEMRDTADRRYGHPFITCTNCGPRYTVITDLPYDRPATTMTAFPMCDACAVEYHDPTDRRFHAQTIACPRLWTAALLGSPRRWESDCRRNRYQRRPPQGPSQRRPPQGLSQRRPPLSATDRSSRSRVSAATTSPAAPTTTPWCPDCVPEKTRPAKPFAVMVADLAAARC